MNLSRPRNAGPQPFSNCRLAIASATAGDLRRAVLDQQQMQRILLTDPTGPQSEILHTANNAVHSMNQMMYRAHIAQLQADQPLAGMYSQRHIAAAAAATASALAPPINGRSNLPVLPPSQQRLVLQRYLWNHTSFLPRDRQPTVLNTYPYGRSTPHHRPISSLVPLAPPTRTFHHPIASGGAPTRESSAPLHLPPAASATISNNNAATLRPSAPTDNSNLILLQHAHRPNHAVVSSTPFAPLLPRHTAATAQGQEIVHHGDLTFPRILHRALSELEFIPGGMETAAFLSDGRSFQIKNRRLLETEVLPIYFPKMRNFASFQRQLNLYNFKRISKEKGGIQQAYYRHDLFIRNFPALSSQMKRDKIKRLVRQESTTNWSVVELIPPTAAAAVPQIVRGAKDDDETTTSVASDDAEGKPSVNDAALLVSLSLGSEKSNRKEDKN